MHLPVFYVHQSENKPQQPVAIPLIAKLDVILDIILAIKIARNKYRIFTIFKIVVLFCVLSFPIYYLFFGLFCCLNVKLTEKEDVLKYIK